MLACGRTPVYPGEALDLRPRLVRASITHQPPFQLGSNDLYGGAEQVELWLNVTLAGNGLRDMVEHGHHGAGFGTSRQAKAPGQRRRLQQERDGGAQGGTAGSGEGGKAARRDIPGSFWGGFSRIASAPD